jgi:hypothetical protein
MQAGFRFGSQVAQFLDVVDIGKRLQVFQTDLLQFIDNLLAESITVDEEQNAAEAFGFDQAVGQTDACDRLPSPSSHGHQQLALASRNATFDGTDGLLLIVAQGQVS